MKKLYDIVAKVGEYQGKDGETKARWQTVGAMLEGEKGPFLMLAKWFNPAGVQDARGGESLLLSLFEPKQDERGQGQRQQREQPPVSGAREVPSAAKTAAAQKAAPQAKAAREDEIPF